MNDYDVDYVNIFWEDKHLIASDLVIYINDRSMKLFSYAVNVWKTMTFLAT
jgi:hypothetical protein